MQLFSRMIKKLWKSTSTNCKTMVCFWATTLVRLQTVLTLRPGSNVTLSACRTQLNKVRLQCNCSGTVDSNFVLNSCWLSKVVSMKHMFLARVVFLKMSLVLRYSLEQIMSTVSVLTFCRHTAFLPTFRKELEFGFAVETLEHSDKSDSGQILSCLDDRLSSSYSESKAVVVIHIYIPTSIATSLSHHSF